MPDNGLAAFHKRMKQVKEHNLKVLRAERDETIERFEKGETVYVDGQAFSKPKDESA